MYEEKNNSVSAKPVKMTDAELAKKLGHYQAVEGISMLLGIVLVAAGCISAFIQHDVVLLSVLTFTGVGLFIFLALPAQKKKKALMHQQLGDYFRTELRKAFGPEPETIQLPVDDTYLKNAALIKFPWTECSVENFHEGMYNGLHFSAANVELCRTVEERSGPQNDNWMTKKEMLFRGIVVRCKDICDPALNLVIWDRFQDRKKDDVTDQKIFREHFSVCTAEGQIADERITSQMRELVQKLEAFANKGRVGGLILQDGTLTLALNTRYVFADIPEELDLRDIDGIRKWFRISLAGMGQLLDILKTSMDSME